ncbi:MAG: chitobiase/beta-hexosaminidase C-terminal domain-containing protein [Spirochaetales bacterium]|nr:chitobiase/beta-hexosaminidase C-terminal domain-containing protein [Spirochaetales bacterium]
MRIARSAVATLFACLASLLLSCSLLIETPEYSIELTVERPAYKSAEAQDVRITYRVATSEEEDLRARYQLTGTDGSVLESGVISPVVSGAPQVRDIDLSGYPGFGEGKYAFRFVGQTGVGDGTYQDLAFLDRTVEFWVDDTPPALPVIGVESGMYGDAALTVEVSHPEWASPAEGASPVDVFYTLDGSAPSFLSTRYRGPIRVDSTAEQVTLRALALDRAGNDSGEPTPAETYSFMSVLRLEPEVVVRPPGFWPIDLIGYGYAAVEDMHVEVWDGMGDTSISAVAVSLYSYDPSDPGDFPVVQGATQRLRVAVDFESVIAGDPTVDPGTGRVLVQNTAEPTAPIVETELEIQ